MILTRYQSPFQLGGRGGTEGGGGECNTQSQILERGVKKGVPGGLKDSLP